jgi:hypothetical protein
MTRTLSKFYQCNNFQLQLLQLPLPTFSTDTNYVMEKLPSTLMDTV